MGGPKDKARGPNEKRKRLSIKPEELEDVAGGYWNVLESMLGDDGGSVPGPTPDVTDAEKTGRRR